MHNQTNEPDPGKMRARVTHDMFESQTLNICICDTRTFSKIKLQSYTHHINTWGGFTEPRSPDKPFASLL